MTKHRARAAGPLGTASLTHGAAMLAIAGNWATAAFAFPGVHLPEYSRTAAITGCAILLALFLTSLVAIALTRWRRR